MYLVLSKFICTWFHKLCWQTLILSSLIKVLIFNPKENIFIQIDKIMKKTFIMIL